MPYSLSVKDPMRLDPKTVHAPEIGPVWLNSPPLTLRQLRGSVVLVDFWDFTCVNCIRTLPYIVEWHKRYAPLGLHVIGVHAPEFYFGRAPEILERGIEEFGIRYPVLLDNDYVVWKAFANKYWPSKYLIDADGYMRYFHAGEGNYQETELALQDLLREIDPSVKLPPLLPLRSELDEPGALAMCPRPTPELYLGHKRGRIANGFVEDKEHTYTLGAGPQEDMPEIEGRWHSLPDCLQTASAGARIILFYSAAEVNIVLAGVGRVGVRENGVEIGAIEVNRPRMYRVIQRERFDTALLELTFDSPSMQVFAFTFGSCL